MATEQWRQFSWFTSESTTTLDCPPAIPFVHSNPNINLVLLPDNQGNLSLLAQDGTLKRTWAAFPNGRVTHILSGQAKWLGLLITAGVHSPSSPLLYLL